MRTIFFLVSSLPTDSLKNRLSHVTEWLLAQDVRSRHYDLVGVSFLNGDAQGKVPGSVQALREAMSNVDSIVWTMSRNNFALRSAVKNAIDWVSH